MRFCFALLLLILSIPAQSAICADGVTRRNDLTLCPARLFSPNATAITSSSASIDGENDAQGIGSTRTIYVSTSAYPPGCSAGNVSGLTEGTAAYDAAIMQCLRLDNFKAGTGASIAAVTESLVYAGPYLKVVTGLASNTTYYAYSVAHGPVGCDTYPDQANNCNTTVSTSLVQKTTFTTLTGGGEEFVADAGAAPVFIGTGGNDLNDGLTHANRWLLLTKVTGALPAGTNVGLFNTSTFTGTLDITHGATSEDRNIVGGYKLNGGSVPIWIVDGVFGSGSTDTKPIIDGHLDNTCVQAFNCDYRTAALTAAGLSGQYDSLITITGTADYTTLRNVVVQYSGANGIVVAGTSGNPAANIILDGAESLSSATYGILLDRYTQDTIVRNSYVDRHNMCRLQLGQAGSSLIQAGTDCANGYWGGGLSSSNNGVGRNLIESSVVARGYGEAISVLGSQYHIVRNNVTSDSLSISIYLDATAYTVAEGNRVIGGSNYAGTGSLGGNFSSSIASAKEDFWGTNGYLPVGNVIRNNLCVRADRCVNVLLESAQNAAGREVNNVVSGNTSIRDTAYAWTHLTYSNTTRAWFHNNVSWGNYGSDLCYWPTINGTTITASHNHSLVTADDVDCRTNATTGDPGIGLSPISAWDSFDWDTFPTWANATPTGAGAIDQTGTARTTVVLTSTNYGVAYNNIAEVLTGALTQAEWQAENAVDAEGTTRASPPSRGAIE